MTLTGQASTVPSQLARCHAAHGRQLSLAILSARSSIVEVRSPTGEVAEGAGHAVAVRGWVIGGQTDCEFLSRRVEVTQVAMVGSLAITGRGPLATSLAWIGRRVTHRLGAVF